ncbi:cytochrome P450 [Cladochytrium replicatum]|nr:cytochrome P450 [Cladochytrium replicatum]
MAAPAQNRISHCQHKDFQGVCVGRCQEAKYLHLLSLTLDSFAELAFSADLNSLAAEEPAPYAKLLIAQLSLLSRFNTEKGLVAAVEPNGRARGASLMSANLDGSSSADILQQFLLHAEEQGEEVSDEQLVDHVLNFMIAGLVVDGVQPQNPGMIQNRVEEFDRVGPISDISYDEINNRFPYGNAVFMETLRLYPSVPANFKTAVVDEVLPDGTVIPKGTSVMWKVYLKFQYQAMGRTRRIWGTDAADFRPERGRSSPLLQAILCFPLSKEDLHCAWESDWLQSNGHFN